MKRFFTTKTSYLILVLLFLIAIIVGIVQRDENLFALPDKNSLEKRENQTNSDLEYYYQESLSNTEHKQSLSFIAVGDIMLSRVVADKIAKSKDNELPFRKISNYLKSSDFNFANLESPISGKNTWNSTGSLIFNTPLNSLEGLINNNFPIVTMANNHALDQGVEAISYSKNYLKEKNIEVVGIGENLDQAFEGKVINRNGVSIGFIGVSYASINDNGASENKFVARMEDKTRLQNSITELKNRSDFIIVAMHAGTEYTRLPNQFQKEFAKFAIDSGADMVIGAHPHWIQTIENYKGKYIFYSLGNFIFDQEWSRDTKEGLTIKVTLEKSAANPNNPLQGNQTPITVKQIELVPIIIENYCCARLANQEEKAQILKKINQTSDLLFP